MEKASKATPYSMPKAGINGWGDLAAPIPSLSPQARLRAYLKKFVYLDIQTPTYATQNKTFFFVILNLFQNPLLSKK